MMNPARQAALNNPRLRPPAAPAAPSKKKLNKTERKQLEEEEREAKWLQHRAQFRASQPPLPPSNPAFLPLSSRPPPPTSVPPPANGKHLSEEQHLSLHHYLSYPPNSLPPPSDSFLSLLHAEMAAFTLSVAITAEERAAKEAVVGRIRAALTPLWGNEADVVPFGSFCTDLSLPHSDVDVSLRLPDSTAATVAGDLRDVQTAITCQPFERLPTFQLVGRARVPILRYVDEDRGVKVDMCVNQADGPAAVAVMRGYLARHPLLRPLVLVLKALLRRIGLSEVYTGGINSYILQLMAVFFLQVYEMAEGGPPSPDAPQLGRLLCSFLDFYGNRFDYVNYGCQLGRLPSEEQPEPAGCAYFSKLDRGWVDVGKPGLLSIEDPCDASHDCGAGSFGVGRVQRCFSLAHERLCLMSAEWEHTGKVTPVVAPSSATAEQGGDDAEEEEESEEDEEDDERLSVLERKAREDERRMVVGPVLRVLFTRQLYVHQVLIDHEERAKAAKGGPKPLPSEPKALKKALKRKRRREDGATLPPSDDERDGTRTRKLTKKEKKRLKRERKQQQEALTRATAEQPEQEREESKEEKKRRKKERGAQLTNGNHQEDDGKEGKQKKEGKRKRENGGDPDPVEQAGEEAEKKTEVRSAAEDVEQPHDQPQLGGGVEEQTKDKKKRKRAQQEDDSPEKSETSVAVAHTGTTTTSVELKGSKKKHKRRHAAAETNGRAVAIDA